MNSKISAFTAFLVLVASSVTQGQISNEVSAQDKSCHERAAKILILGTYHFDNPGLDSANIQADDVLADKRQREIAIVLDKLAVYTPTRIAIEAPYKSVFWQERYKKYLDGNYKLGRNEIEQLGFRLAKRFSLPTLFPVDFQMFMSGLTDNEIENKKSTVSVSAPKEPKSVSARPLTDDEKRFVETPIIGHLIRMNKPESISKSHEQYMLMLYPDFENPAIYEKADRVTNWYKRNLRIFANLNRITEFNGHDRVLLIVGAGHLKLLSDLAIESPQFCFVEAETYLKG